MALNSGVGVGWSYRRHVTPSTRQIVKLFLVKLSRLKNCVAPSGHSSQRENSFLTITASREAFIPRTSKTAGKQTPGASEPKSGTSAAP